MEGEKQSFQEIMSRIGEGLNTHAVFGEPQQVDGSAIIPVAKIRYGGGGGLGGESRGAEGREAAGAGEGMGMGMGFGASAEPLGIVRVGRDTIEWVPIVDRSRLLLVWSIVSGFLLIMAARRVFSRR